MEHSKIDDANVDDGDDFFGDQGVDDLITGEKDTIVREREHKKNAYVEAVNSQHGISLQKGYEEGLLKGLHRGKPFGVLMGKVCSLLMYLTTPEHGLEENCTELIDQLQTMYEALYVLDEQSFADSLIHEPLQEEEQKESEEEGEVKSNGRDGTSGKKIAQEEEEARTKGSCECGNTSCGCSGDDKDKKEGGDEDETQLLDNEAPLLDYETMLISCQHRIALLEQAALEFISQ